MYTMTITVKIRDDPLVGGDVLGVAQFKLQGYNYNALESGGKAAAPYVVSEACEELYQAIHHPDEAADTE